MSILSVSSYSCGKWVRPGNEVKRVLSPVSGEAVAEIPAAPPDMAAMAKFARTTGGPKLRALTFHDRARLLKALAARLQDEKERLYQLNPLTGATRNDGWYDIDGGIGTVFTYASKGRREMPDDQVYIDGQTEILSRNGTFLGLHAATPLQGVALQINAFNFPVWGMLEKLAPAILAGVPAIIKPAGVTSYLAEECFRIIIESGILPEGAAQFAAGGTSGLLDPLGTQDIVCFTGSETTAGSLRAHPSIRSGRTRLIAEQDSLNATILGPDAEPGSADFQIFAEEAVREITVKAGQKCTAVRRILVPQGFLDDTVEALSERLSAVVIGDPGQSRVSMGSLVSREQRSDAAAKAAQIGAEAELVFGNPDDFPLEGDGAVPDAFLPPLLFRCADPDGADLVHRTEAFGPVSTIMPYEDIGHAARLANLGGGSLVVSAFTSDPGTARKLLLASGAWHGRIYFNNTESRSEATGHGSPMPHMLHGGPGRAGGGEELGGIRSVLNFMQRTAVQGTPQFLTAISNSWVSGGDRRTGGTHLFRRDFDELRVGDSLTTGSRRISLEDIEKFAGFTGDRFYAHMDDEAARRNPFFPGRVAHGYLLLSFAAGLFVDPDEGPVLANTGLTDLAFEQPVPAGDEIHVTLTVKRKTPRTPEYGEIRWHVEILNQRNERVASYELRTMNARS